LPFFAKAGTGANRRRNCGQSQEIALLTVGQLKIDEYAVFEHSFVLMQIKNLKLFCDLVETQSFTRT
jgi:hypothetical protein